MSNPLPAFEIHTGLTVQQAAKLLGIATPTYYQYRRSGKMPDSVRRHVQSISLHPQPMLNKLIQEHVYDGEDTL